MNQARSNLSALLLSGGMLLLLFAYTPHFNVPVCGFHWLTGRPCPLCGLTRAMFQIAKGQWQSAIANHALSPLVFLLLLATFIVNLRPQWKRVACPALLRQRAWLIGAGLFAVYGVGRAFL